jgi:predicted SprT family Zn-dependent metalloprotease
VKITGLNKKTARTLKTASSKWCRLWHTSKILQNISILISPRLQKSLGSCSPASNEIRLHPGLLELPNTCLLEVLCHELAHLAAWQLHGPTIGPHGPEWAALVRAAGFTPKTVLRVAVLQGKHPKINQPPVKYRHYCPVCQTTRFSVRPQRAWRCANCVAAGLSGKMTIESYTTGK